MRPVVLLEFARRDGWFNNSRSLRIFRSWDSWAASSNSRAMVTLPLAVGLINLFLMFRILIIDKMMYVKFFVVFNISIFFSFLKINSNYIQGGDFFVFPEKAIQTEMRLSCLLVKFRKKICIKNKNHQ